MLADLPLSRTEREVVKRYEQDPAGRTFLPVADILRSHRLVDESLELLMQGVERHPNFTVARVVLARELLQKGLISDGWKVLEDSPVSLRDNLLAQKLRFRLALLLRKDDVVYATYKHLKIFQMLDAELNRLGDLMEISGIDKARERLIRDMRERGTDPVLPETEGSFQEDQDTVIVKNAPIEEKPRSTGSYLSKDFWDEATEIEGFHVVPLKEIFRPGDGEIISKPGDGGVELDSTTMADIYAKQGHYSKALSVYRRLLRMTPGNDMIKRKVADLSKLEKEQRDVDLSVDASLVDRMESVEILDRQINFFNHLLNRLS